MIEINISKNIDGFAFKIKSIEKTIIKCPPHCEHREYSSTCIEKQAKSLGLSKIDNYSCIKILFNVVNTTQEDSWTIRDEDISLVDNDGYTYNGLIFCEYLKSKNTDARNHIIAPHTQSDFYMLFPLLDNGKEVSRIIVANCNKFIDFKISDSTDTLENVITSINTTNESRNKSRELSSGDIFYMKGRIINLKVDMFSRLNNVLYETQCTKLENKINTDIFRLKIELQQYPQPEIKEIIDELNVAVEEYEAALKKKKDESYAYKIKANSIQDMLEMEPKKFEDYIGQLFRNLGYTVNVTPYSNDKGIDIIMEKDGVKYGVQCKRYKGVVSVDEMQTFIGALTHINADKGFFVTTGMFSLAAERLSHEFPIELINRIELLKLIEIATKK